MKKYLLILFAIGMIFSFSSAASAQNSGWIYVGTHQGVSVHWRYRQELKDQYISELKFDNTNGYKVEISVKSRFVCASGEEVIGIGQMDTIAANDSKGGQWAGYFYYPCGGTKPPRSGGFKDFTVKRLQ